MNAHIRALSSLLLLGLLRGAGPAAAERLPWTFFTVSEGLAGDTVRDLHQDSLGFLWIATSSGLSRFDGQVFRNYGVADGLPGPRVDVLAETTDGSIWLGSAQGLARGRPDAAVSGPAFARVPVGLDRIQTLAAGDDGVLYVGNRGGLLRLRPRADSEVAAEPIDLGGEGAIVDVTVGRQGELWIATTTALLHLRPGGERERFVVDPSRTTITTVDVDGDGRVWMIVHRGLLVWWPGAGAPPPALVNAARWPAHPGDLPRAPGDAVLYDHEHGLPDRYSTDVTIGRGATWVATRGGVVRFAGGGMTVLGVEQGLNEPNQNAALEDAYGTLWLGSDSRGLARLGRSGFIAFGEPDGLDGGRVNSIFENGSDLYVVTESIDLYRLAGLRFEKLTPRSLSAGVTAGWGWNQFVLRDRRGAFWYPTADGLFRFPPLSDPAALVTARPERHWTSTSGLPGDDVFRLYEDRRGVVWVSVIAVPPLVTFDGDRIVPVPEIVGPETGGAPSAFAEDGSGNLWMGFYVGGLARYQAGSWRFFGQPDGLPPGFVGDLHFDHTGRLWVATAAGGVAVIEDPAADTLSLRRYTTREGLTTDATRCLAEDRAGRIFVGSTRGVDRLDPETGIVTSYSSGDGLPNSVVWSCHAAADGSLWFGTSHGMARFLPPTEGPAPVPGIRLSAVTVEGRPIPVADRGVERFEGLVLKPGQSSLQVSYVGVGLAFGRNLRFQHRVLGANAEWSPPSAERTVQFAALAPGDYRFEVRAALPDGRTRSGVATLGFKVLPRLYQRRWFPVLVAAALAALAAFFFRLRIARLVAVERTRTRIASDLHDDVGSSVSRVGLLSELARRRLDGSSAVVEELLHEISREVGELAEATSDIVWAVDPRRDDLASLLVRLRRFAADLFEAKDIELEFSAPRGAERVQLSPEIRRALYLTLKEAIHNVAKHSGARRAAVKLELADGGVHGEVWDDGRGIAAGRAEQAEAEGRHGLPGLARRAAEAGGEVRVESAEGGGTRVTLRFRTR